MANSTPSKTSKAKTKTTKKPAVAAAKRTAAKVAVRPAKSVKKNVKNTSASASVVTGKEIKKEAQARRRAARVSRVLSAGSLRKWHLISAVVFVLLAVAAVVFMNDTAYQLLRGHLVSDSLASQTQTVFAPAQHVITNLQVRWLVVVIMVVSALFSAWRYYKEAREREALDTRISLWRWVDFAVTGALIVETIAFLSGMQEIVSLKMLGALVATSAVFALIAERVNAGTARLVRAPFVASFVAGALALLALNAYAVATVVYGLVRSPWYVYALYALAIAAALLVALNQVRGYRRVGRWANYLFVERNYIVLNLVSKVAFAIILIVGLHK
jgi:hypothetical protein